MSRKKIHILGGGTVFHLRPHLALCAPAYGNTAKSLKELCRRQAPDLDTELHLTKMAGGDALETNRDVELLVQSLVDDFSTKIVFLM